jgi:MFS family permease
MLKVLPLFIWAAQSNVIFGASFLPFYRLGMKDKHWGDAKEIEYASLAITFIGVGEIVGNAINGKMLDKLGFKKQVIVCIVQMTIAFAYICWYTINNQWNFYTAAGVAFLMGFQDSGLSNFTNSLGGF